MKFHSPIIEKTKNSPGLEIDSNARGGADIEFCFPGEVKTRHVSLDRKQLAYLGHVAMHTVQGQQDGEVRSFMARCSDCHEMVNIPVEIKVPLYLRLKIGNCPECGVRVSSIIVHRGKYVLI